MASGDTDDDIIISGALLSLQRPINKAYSMTCKQTTDQSQFSDRVSNCRRTEMISIAV